MRSIKRGTKSPTPMSSKKPVTMSQPQSLSRGWAVTQNKRGPSGSPCCTPSFDHRVLSPNQRQEGAPYAARTKASKSGHVDATASQTLSRRIVLKAFAKLSFTNACPSALWSRKNLAACTRASPPPFAPTPSWNGAKRGAHIGVTTELTALATSLLRVRPTAMGRRPPSFFLKGNRVAPKKDG